MQLLVARYREPAWMVRRLLDTVALQQGIDMSDVSVIVANDGPDALPEEAYGGYPFEVCHVTLPHRGVSATRNALLDMAWHDHVMLCDADDMLCGLVGLHVAQRAMSTGIDVFVPSFLEELPDGTFRTRDMDTFFNHGKVFRREYLVANGIRWDDSLTTSGDNYFLWQALSLTDRIAYSPTTYYMWKYNRGSVCRSEDDHFVRDYPKHVRTYRLLCRRFSEIGRDDLVRRFACLMVADAYVYMRTPEWDGHDDSEAVGELSLGWSEWGREWELSGTEGKVAAIAEKCANFRTHVPQDAILDIERWFRSKGIA